MGSPLRCSGPVLYIGAQIISTPDITMIFLLALISSGLASPIEYEAKSPELRALLESGGPADIGGSWTPNLTPEGKAATKFFVDTFNTVELGGLQQLQAKQIPNAYIDDTEDVAAAKAAHMTAVKEAEAAAAMVGATEMKMGTVFRQPLIYYQIPHYLPYHLYGR